MTTEVEFQTKVTKAVVNMGRFDQVTNGDDNTVVDMDGGVKVPSLAKLAKDYGNLGFKTRGQATISASTTLTRSTYVGKNVNVTAPGITITFPDASGGWLDGEAVLLKNSSAANITLAFPGGTDGTTTILPGATATFISTGNGAWRQFFYAPAVGNAANSVPVLGGDGKLAGAILPANVALTGVDGKLPTSLLPEAVLGAMKFRGFWNAATNVVTYQGSNVGPIPAASAANLGYYYIVQTAGTTNVNGITDWQVGDWAVSDGGAFDKIDSSDMVTAVAGLQGNISAAALTATLNAFTSALQGLVPPSGGGTVNFLCADGTWKAPPGSGGGSSTYAVGTFVSLSAATILAGTKVLRVTGYDTAGFYPFELAYDPTINDAYVAANPRSAVKTANGLYFRNVEPVLMPEHFGAKGDGATNDTAAFVALSKEITRRNGAYVNLRRVAYIFGDQSAQANGVCVGPSPFNFDGLSGKVTIRGNGAIIRTAPGLKYGAFNPATGLARTGITSGTPSDVASPFSGVVVATNCTGTIWVDGLEADGNMAALTLGGQYGDTGYQIAHCGVLTLDNPGSIFLLDLYLHHMGQDGLLTRVPVASNAAASIPLYLCGVRSEYNARQGWSQIGGNCTVAINSKFNFTGRGSFASNPAAGLDVEAEYGYVDGSYVQLINRNFSAINCEFIANLGAGVVSDTGDSADMNFTDCRVTGGNNSYALYPNKPGFTFTRGRVVGPSAGFFADSTGNNSPKFYGTKFLDAPSLSPLGSLLGGPIIDLSTSNTQTLLDDVMITLTNNCWLPYTAGGARYRNVRMTATNGNTGVPSGTYAGQNVVNGSVNTSGFTIAEGKTTVNGSAMTPSGGSSGVQGIQKGVVSNAAGGGLGATSTITVSLYGFNATTSVFLPDAWGGGENVATDRYKVKVTDVVRRSDGADVTVRNDGASTQTVNLGYWIG